MTIRGQARSLTVKVLYGGSHPVPKEGTYEIFQTEFAVKRHEYGVVGGSLLGPAISEEVRIKLIPAGRH